jgi:hypothetical protein
LRCHLDREDGSRHFSLSDFSFLSTIALNFLIFVLAMQFARAYVCSLWSRST